MRKSLWIVALLFAAIGAPNAQAQTAIPTFTCTAAWTFTTYDSPTTPCPIIPTAGAVDFSSPVPVLGISYGDVGAWTIVLNASGTAPCCGEGGVPAPGDSYSWGTDCFPGSIVVSPYCYFSVTITSPFGTTYGLILPTYVSQSVFDSYPDEDGTLTFAVVTPELGTAVLWLTGIGLVLVMTRKRIAQDLPQAR